MNYLLYLEEFKGSVFTQLCEHVLLAVFSLKNKSHLFVRFLRVCHILFVDKISLLKVTSQNNSLIARWGSALVRYTAKARPENSVKTELKP